MLASDAQEFMILLSKTSKNLRSRLDAEISEDYWKALINFSFFQVKSALIFWYENRVHFPKIGEIKELINARYGSIGNKTEKECVENPLYLTYLHAAANAKNRDDQRKFYDMMRSVSI